MTLRGAAMVRDYGGSHVFFEGTQGCAWGENGNDPETSGAVAARTEQS